MENSLSGLEVIESKMEPFFISANHIMVVEYSTAGGSFKAGKPGPLR